MILDNQVVGLAGAAQRFGIYVKNAGGASGTFRGCLIRGNWIAELTPQDTNSVGVQVSPGAAVTLTKLVVESNHTDTAGWGVRVSNTALASYSASIWNSTSNATQGTISPGSGSWSVYQQ